MARRRPAKLYRGSKAVLMTRSEGWVMARRPGCIPFTVFAKEWDALPDWWEHIKAIRQAEGHPIQ